MKGFFSSLLGYLVAREGMWLCDRFIKDADASAEVAYAESQKWRERRAALVLLVDFLHGQLSKDHPDIFPPRPSPYECGHVCGAEEVGGPAQNIRSIHSQRGPRGPMS